MPHTHETSTVLALAPRPPPPSIRLPTPFAARRARRSGDLQSPRPSAERLPSTTGLSAEGRAQTPPTPPLLQGAPRHGGGQSAAAPPLWRRRRARAACRLAVADAPCPERRRSPCCPASALFASTCGGGLVWGLPTVPPPLPLPSGGHPRETPPARLRPTPAALLLLRTRDREPLRSAASSDGRPAGGGQERCHPPDTSVSALPATSPIHRRRAPLPPPPSPPPSPPHLGCRPHFSPNHPTRLAYPP